MKFDCLTFEIHSYHYFGLGRLLEGYAGNSGSHSSPVSAAEAGGISGSRPEYSCKTLAWVLMRPYSNCMDCHGHCYLLCQGAADAGTDIADIPSCHSPQWGQSRLLSMPEPMSGQVIFGIKSSSSKSQLFRPPVIPTMVERL